MEAIHFRATKIVFLCIDKWSSLMVYMKTKIIKSPTYGCISNKRLFICHHSIHCHLFKIMNRNHGDRRLQGSSRIKHLSTHWSFDNGDILPILGLVMYSSECSSGSIYGTCFYMFNKAYIKISKYLANFFILK